MRACTACSSAAAQAGTGLGFDDNRGVAAAHMVFRRQPKLLARRGQHVDLRDDGGEPLAVDGNRLDRQIMAGYRNRTPATVLLVAVRLGTAHVRGRQPLTASINPVG